MNIDILVPFTIAKKRQKFNGTLFIQLALRKDFKNQILFFLQLDLNIWNNPIQGLFNLFEKTFKAQINIWT